VAENAKLMGLRAVPDGDEFDKDIALAIRFAVDNGANIINMSFGKYYSPNSEWVTDALAYAMKRNVIVVQAAGNDNRNLDTINCYPIKPAKIKKQYNSYLRIGASTPEGSKAKFSNFGSETVDFFAPGEKITSTATFDQYKTANGTSFAAPIVSGVAALVWGAFPELKAYQVVEILKQSASKNTVNALAAYAFTPGIVDAYQALLIAKEYAQN
jgi:cell wall-associated protease